MTTIALVYFDAGGGHRAAAVALQQAAQAMRLPWQLQRVNLTRVLDPASSFRRLTGFEPEDLYNLRLRRGWTLGLAQELKLLQAGIRMLHAPMVRALARHWQQLQPDLVVSLVPNFNRALQASVAQACPGVPFATVMTDMADHPPHFWIEPGIAQTLVCGTPRAVTQAFEAGLPPRQVRCTSGMILRPSLYPARRLSRAAARQALGLRDERPAGLVLFGGHGSVQMLRIARALPETPLIFACGHNAALAAELRALQRPAPHVVLGFVHDIGPVMRAADFFIGKPGPGSLSEAVFMGLPVLSFDNAWTMPQERWNLQWLREHGYGLAVRSLRELPEACAQLVAELPAYQARVARHDNQAVWEVLDELAALLEPAAPLLEPSVALPAA